MTAAIASAFKLAFAALGLMAALVASPSFAITIDGESRLTEEQVAKKHGLPVAEVKKKFAASGTLECSDHRGPFKVTAQLVGQNDIIVDSATCLKRVGPEQCTFKAHDGERAITRAVQAVAMGEWRCELGANKKAADWAVLKLSSPITTIAPYELGATTDIRASADVMLVAAQSSDFYLGGRLRLNLKTIDDCSIKHTFFLAGRLALLGTNCDTSPGASGGALLARSSAGPPRLLGIGVGHLGKSDLPKRRNAPQDGRFAEGTWSAYAIPLVGEFRDALERAVGGRISQQ